MPHLSSFQNGVIFWTKFKMAIKSKKMKTSKIPALGPSIKYVVCFRGYHQNRIFGYRQGWGDGHISSLCTLFQKKIT